MKVNQIQTISTNLNQIQASSNKLKDIYQNVWNSINMN